MIRGYIWLTLSGALVLAAAFTNSVVRAQSLGGSPNTGLGSRASALSPLIIDPDGAEDPYVVFERWRRTNHVTLMAPAQVVQAHRLWLLNHPVAQPTSSDFSALSPSNREASAAVISSLTVGPNVDLGPVSAYQGEVAIAINQAAPAQLVAGANTFFMDSNCPAPGGIPASTQALYGSSDAGATWTYKCAPWPSGDIGGAGPIFFGSDPAVAWDANGNAYAAYLLVSSDATQKVVSDALVVARSTNAGKSWSPAGTIVNNLDDPTVFNDKEMIAVDTSIGGAHTFHNRIYVIWDKIAANGTQTEVVAHSDDAGKSWITRKAESMASPSDIGGDLAIGADGTVYAVWNRIFGFTTETGETTVFAKSVDGGSTWSTPLTIATHHLLSFGKNNTIPAQDMRGINAFAAIAVDRHRNTPNFGNLYVVYTDFPGSGAAKTDTNIYLTRSTNGGATWSSALKVNNDTGTASQFFPWIAVDPSNGQTAVSWYDTRNDPTNRQTQIFMAVSTNGGLSFGANQLVTKVSSQFSNKNSAFSDENSTDNPGANPNQYGDYAQIDALKGLAYPIWTDSRMFYPTDPGTGVLEDAASARVRFASPPATPTATRTPTKTPTHTRSATRTPTRTAIRTPSRTPTRKPSPTPTR